MKFILIVFAALNSGMDVTAVEFDSRPACEGAVAALRLQAKKQHWTGGYSKDYIEDKAIVVCVLKGTELPT